eukprot:gnl/Dysnectes_brevis/5580_a8089_320.p1 GENE.gnl/Dysnectes_brevis/5580_a8089_320~~gnl/Dysnectes_brevis/5580_a8089_320.p1  ORF type:complete len:329 (+),score=86.73 gnl/Dysnectes_brevis/5580_a8089_320:52-987(+)
MSESEEEHLLQHEKIYPKRIQTLISPLQKSCIEIGDYVAAGFFARVYKGVLRTKTDSPPIQVAIKAIRAKEIERILVKREVDVSEVSHTSEHLTNLYGGWKDKSFFYIALQWCDGDSATALMRRKDVIVPLATRIRIALHVARGLACLHRAGVLHRDIKGDNVLFLHPPQLEVCGKRTVIPPDGVFALLTDFGLSRRINAASPLSLRGTPYYLSPEMISDQPYTLKLDVFIFGLFVLELLGVPLDPNTLRDDDYYVQTGVVESLPVPDGLKRLILDCCCVRPPSARPTMHTVLSRLSLLDKLIAPYWRDNL